MRDYLSFHLNGRPVRITGADAFLSLSDFLRRRQRLTGTKVVCAEGDCGSCSVLIGRREQIGGAFKYTTVTSCIAMVFQLDGAHVVTVEGLGDAEHLSPVQAAMKECHGAQCGFCTPGFVATLTQMVNDGVPMTRDNACRALVGNLCRCTGYDAILRAAERVDTRTVVKLETTYASAKLEAAEGDVLIETPTHRVYVPATLAQALAYRAENPNATIVAGSTDVGVLVNKRVRELSSVLAINGVPELRGAQVADGAIVVGAAATLTELEALALEQIPALGEFLSWFGSPPIKNAGTLGGNLATGSPIGDSLPALMALGASVELASTSSRRSVALTEFYTGYRKSVTRPDELISLIRIPIPQNDQTLKLFKVSKRRDLDISTVSGAFLLTRDGETITDARIALGGVGPTVVRATAAEAALVGKTFALDAFEAASEAVRRTVAPISDVRGSADYRRAVAANLVLRCFHELGEGTVLA